MALQSYLKIGERNTQDNSTALNRIISTSSHFPHPLFTFSLMFPTLGQASHFLTVACLFHCLFPVDDNDNGDWVNCAGL